MKEIAATSYTQDDFEYSMEKAAGYDSSREYITPPESCTIAASSPHNQDAQRTSPVVSQQGDISDTQDSSDGLGYLPTHLVELAMAHAVDLDPYRALPSREPITVDEARQRLDAEVERVSKEPWDAWQAKIDAEIARLASSKPSSSSRPTTAEPPQEEAIVETSQQGLPRALKGFE